MYWDITWENFRLAGKTTTIDSHQRPYAPRYNFRGTRLRKTPYSGKTAHSAIFSGERKSSRFLAAHLSYVPWQFICRLTFNYGYLFARLRRLRNARDSYGRAPTSHPRNKLFILNSIHLRPVGDKSIIAPSWHVCTCEGGTAYEKLFHTIARLCLWLKGFRGKFNI